MIGELYFNVKLGWSNTTYDSLKSLGTYQYNKYTKKYDWKFKVEHLKEIMRITGKSIVFEEEEVKKIVDYCPPILEKITKDGVYGKSGWEVKQLGPKLFRLVEWRRGKELSHDVTSESVNALWEVIKNYEIGLKVKGTTIQEHVCRNLGLTRFFRDSDSFDEHKFFGNRTCYMNYYYHGIKVLQSYGLVEHTLKGKIKRLKERLEFQTKII